METKDLKIDTICFVAGRSGGHIIPALTLAHQELDKNQQTRILFFTANTKLDHTIMRTSNRIDQHVTLHLDNIPQKKLQWIGFAYRALKACYTSWRILRQTKPTKIISMGGYISLPVCLMGHRLNIPVEVIELNVEPGKATKFLSHLASRILVCFEETKKYFPKNTCTLIPYPVRFSETEQRISKEEARAQLSNIPSYRRTVLVLGGSQGSAFLNNLIHSWLRRMSIGERQLLYIMHQVGSSADAEAWSIWYSNCEVHAHVFNYHHDMATMYAAADIVVCRAGAGTLFEALLFNKECITIPLEIPGNNHQVANALAMAQLYPHLFMVVRQTDQPTKFMRLICEKLSDNTIPQDVLEYRKKFISIE